MNYFNLLSASGGGFMGMSEILVMEELEKKSGKLSCELFNAMAGSSAGFINVACASIGISASKIKEFYTIWGPKIFKRNIWDLEADTMLDPKYDNKELILALKTLLTINDENGPRQATLNDCKTKLIGTTLNIGEGLPTIFCSWLPSQVIKIKDRILGEIIGNDSKMELSEMVLCSTAAPSYFNGVQINNNVYVDGGLVQNSPDSLLIDFISNYCDNKQLRMLSLGSGDSKWDIKGSDMIEPSILTVGKTILECFLTNGEDASNLSAYMRLKDNYYRLSPVFNPELKMDDIKNGLKQIPAAVDKLLKENQDIINIFTKDLNYKEVMG